MRPCAVFAILMLFGIFLMAADPAPDKKEEKSPQDKALEIPEAKAEYDAYTKSLDAVVKAYAKALDSEEEKARKAGDLDLIMAIQAEKKAVEESKAESTADWTKTKGLAAAQKTYNEAMAKTMKGYLQKLEEIIKKRSSAAIRKLLDLKPQTARVLRKSLERPGVEEEVEIPAESLMAEEIVIVRPGSPPLPPPPALRDFSSAPARSGV